MLANTSVPDLFHPAQSGCVNEGMVLGNHSHLFIHNPHPKPTQHSPTKTYSQFNIINTIGAICCLCETETDTLV